MNYRQIISKDDRDIPYLLSVLRLPEISRYISIDEDNYWHYVTDTENVFYFKVYDGESLVAAIHCELCDTTLYMSIMVLPHHQKSGIGTAVINDILTGRLPFDFERIEVSIDESNLPSIKLFEKTGFIFVSRENELLTYVSTPQK